MWVWGRGSRAEGTVPGTSFSTPGSQDVNTPAAAAPAVVEGVLWALLSWSELIPIEASIGDALATVEAVLSWPEPSVFSSAAKVSTGASFMWFSFLVLGSEILIPARFSPSPSPSPLPPHPSGPKSGSASIFSSPVSPSSGHFGVSWPRLPSSRELFSTSGVLCPAKLGFWSSKITDPLLTTTASSAVLWFTSTSSVTSLTFCGVSLVSFSCCEFKSKEKSPIDFNSFTFFISAVTHGFACLSFASRFPSETAWCNTTSSAISCISMSSGWCSLSSLESNTLVGKLLITASSLWMLSLSAPATGPLCTPSLPHSFPWSPNDTSSCSSSSSDESLPRWTCEQLVSGWFGSSLFPVTPSTSVTKPFSKIIETSLSHNRSSVLGWTE